MWISLLDYSMDNVQVLYSIISCRDDAFEPSNARQVSSGYGIHLYIGASLARMEATVAFEEILKRDLEETPEWAQNPFFRGVEALRLRTHGGF